VSEELNATWFEICPNTTKALECIEFMSGLTGTEEWFPEEEVTMYD
jgi:hypothetical protein